MNRLAAWARTVLLGYRRTLTDAQLNGAACALCGHPFTGTEPRVSYGWIGLPLRRRAYACRNACTLTTVDDTTALFRTAIPPRQDVWFWHLGVDDVPDVGDTTAQAHLDALDAQPRATVEITHRTGTLATRPLPAQHAAAVAEQAARLGFTARAVRRLDEHTGSRP